MDAGPQENEEEEKVGIFELPLVLLPGEKTPLHVFEQRYRTLINKCVDDNAPFGFLYRDDDGVAATIGCSALISDVLERLDDGRINIVVTGGLPFRVLDRFEGADYPAATIEWIDPGAEPQGSTEDQALRATLTEGAREGLRTLLAAIGQTENEPPELDDLDAFGIASLVELPAEPKQAMLAAGNEIGRLRLLIAALQDVEATLIKAQEISEIAQTNGHGELE